VHWDIVVHDFVLCISVIFKKIPKVNNQPIGKNSPNLVTLVHSSVDLLKQSSGTNSTTSEFSTTYNARVVLG
jgi:hypothetical protein